MVRASELTSLLDSLARDASRKTTVEIWASFEKRLCDTGIRSVHYESGVPQQGSAELCLKTEGEGRPSFGDLISQEFMLAVRDNPEFHDADGFVQHCANSVLPLVYDAEAVEELPENMHGINDLARDFGATGGVIVPLRGFGEATYGNVTYMLDRHSPLAPKALPAAELTALAHILHGSLSGTSADEPHDDFKLTRQEVACLTHVAYGLSTKRLSHCMGISDATANEYIRNACRKLKSPSRAAAVARAVALGLVQV